MLNEASPEDTLPPSQAGPSQRATAPIGGGALFRGRFVPGETLGHGSRATVYSATDAHSGQLVALKVFQEIHPEAREEQRRELAMLQRCAIEGVVRLLAHDLSGDQPWLAMEHLDRALLPPSGEARDWSSMEGSFIALFETVARLHALGVAHRDIKPQNLRRRPGDGRPVLIDLGIAAPIGAEPDPRLAPGTPLYMAPELRTGEKVVDGKADVFALGVVLYEALSGSLPFPEQDNGYDADPVPAQIPRYVGDLLRSMLSRRPEARPTMAQAAALLRGAPLEDTGRWLGDRSRLAALGPQPGKVRAIGGPRGSGRSRLLQELAATLGEVRWLLPGERPFAALSRLLGEPGDGTAEQLQAWFQEELSKLQAPILADDWSRIDPESAALLLESPPPGGLLRVVEGPGELQAPLLTEGELIPLFAGPDRVLHLQEDAAKELLRRSGGHAPQVAALLRRWQEDGIADRQGDLLTISRANLDSLAVELQGDLPRGGSHAPLNEAEDELVAAARFAGAHATPENLACILDLSSREVQTMLDRLLGAEVLALDGTRVVPRVEPRSRWSEARCALSSRRLAQRLPHGSPGRTELMRKGELREGLVEQALAEAEQLERRDQPARAIPLLEELLPAAPGDERVLAHLVHAKLQQRSDEETEGARLLASRSPALLALVQAVALARHGDASRGYARLRELKFTNPKLEMLRLASLVDAARRGAPTRQEALLDELGSLPIIQGDPEHLARWRTWYGGLRYHQRRYAEAGDFHASAAARERLVGRLSSLTNAARSYLEACDFSRTRANAEGAIELARGARLCLYEAEAEWALRAVANRQGATVIDEELITCAELLRSAALLARVYLTEAFIAWRGQHPRAVELARKAEHTLQGASLATPAAHAAALALASSGEGDHDAVADALWQGRERFAEVVLDGLALLGPPYPGTAAERLALASWLPEDTWHIPRGALSIHEALRRVG